MVFRIMTKDLRLVIFFRSTFKPGESWSAGGPAQKSKKTVQKYRRNRQQGPQAGLHGKGSTVKRGGSIGLVAPPQPMKRFSH